jgi:hypothetical protein
MIYSSPNISKKRLGYERKRERRKEMSHVSNISRSSDKS